MLSKLRKAGVSERSAVRAKMDAVREADVTALFAEQIVDMPALAPPKAVNDDPMAHVAIVVERELRAVGYLR